MLSNTETKLKKTLLIKKARMFIVSMQTLNESSFRSGLYWTFQLVTMTYYDSIRTTMTQNILTMSHYDPLRATMTQILLSRFVLNQKKEYDFLFSEIYSQKILKYFILNKTLYSTYGHLKVLTLNSAAVSRLETSPKSYTQDAIRNANDMIKRNLKKLNKISDVVKKSENV